MCPPAGFEGDVAPYRTRTGEKPETVRIWLLGGFKVSVGSRIIEGDEWRLRKAASLVKLLALAPGHRLHREQVMDVLWPDLGRQAASNNLRKTLHTSRRILDPDAGPRYLATVDESLALYPSGNLWVDVETFEEAAATARRSKDPASYWAALDLYVGDLLPEDRYEEWAESKRQELRRLYLSLLVESARLYEERGEHERGTEVLQRVVAEEPTLEEAHAGLMRLYALVGQEGEALTQYERLRGILSREHGAEPSTATRRLREEILAGSFSLSQLAGHPSEEPPDPNKHNLPAPRDSFVGREREMLEVKRALVMTRLLTLTGAGGSGKTRLALVVARDLVGIYPDGVWLVQMAGLSEAELVPQAVAEALEAPERPEEPLIDTLAEVLRARQLLLILDNCEHLLEATARLVDSFLDSCPGLRILATSREALGVEGEVRWAVLPLTVPDPHRSPTVEELEKSESARLFLARARNRDSSFAFTPDNAQAVAEICRRLEGIPLAIELAAARMGTLSLQHISQRLEGSLELLTGGARTALRRQRTLKGTLDWSYELLSKPEQKVFRRLSVFAGGWSLEASETVGSGEGIERSEVLDLLFGLVEKSLVIVEPTAQGRGVRYRLLEPIRQYALEKLEQCGEAEDLKQAHAEYFLTLAEEAEPELIGPREAEWFERFEEELDNVRAALSRAQAHGEAEFGLRLAGALMAFWFWEGRYSEGRGWLEGALAEEGPTSAMARAKALGAASLLAWRQGDYARTKSAVEEGLRLSEAAGIEDSRAPFFLGGTYRAFFLNLTLQYFGFEGDFERARALGEESMAIYRRAHDLRGIVWPLGLLAVVTGDRGDYEQAEKLHAEGLSLARKLDSAILRFHFLASWGWTSLLQGDHQRATALAEEAIELARERRRGFMGLLARAVDTLGWAALVGGDLKRAKTSFEESLTLSREVGDKENIYGGLEGLACIAGGQGDALRAARLFGGAEALREALGIPRTLDLRKWREPYVVGVRSQLDEAGWEEAFADGKSMGLEVAVEYALSDQELATPSALTPEQSAGREQPTALTRREEEVAVLVAQGLTNRQIASELMLSEHTVTTHVRNILKKLSLHSRAQLTAWMTEQQPLR